jgi:ligand-binding SRPBCC domain-containing protein
MRDVVHYKIPLGPLGKLINHIYIQHKLKEIFDYRYQTLEKMFGKM